MHHIYCLETNVFFIGDAQEPGTSRFHTFMTKVYNNDEIKAFAKYRDIPYKIAEKILVSKHRRAVQKVCRDLNISVVDTLTEAKIAMRRRNRKKN